MSKGNAVMNLQPPKRDWWFNHLYWDYKYNTDYKYRNFYNNVTLV